jgi:hypothetical protein
MTETEWLTGRDDHAMLKQIDDMVSRRKLRILAREIIRNGPKPWTHPRVAQALLLADEVIEGAKPEQALQPFRELVQQVLDSYDNSGTTRSHLIAASFLLDESPTRQCIWAIRNWILGGPPADEKLPPLIRDIFGNPFRPVAFDPRWRTADAVGLARGIYEDRAFDRLPLLADALMDAGCADEQVLSHCRSEGPHVRGCWVVDLVLGKE